MSFKTISVFLQTAFNRIDAAHTKENGKIPNKIESVFYNAVPQAKGLKIYNEQGSLVVYTHSQTTKHLIFLNKSAILGEIRNRFPHVTANEIKFKGPRRRI